MICEPHRILLRVLRSRSRKWRWQDTGWWGKLKETVHLEDPGVDRSIILKLVLKKWIEKMWSELIWLGICANGKIVWKLGFPKTRGNSWLAGENNRPKFYARRIWAQFKFSLENFCLLCSHLKTWILKYTTYVASAYREFFTTTKFNKTSRATAAPVWSISIFVLPWGLKSDLSDQKKIAGWMCVSARCLKVYLCVRDTIRKDAGQDPTIKCAIVCTPRKILPVLL
jgi:hypothetical protein